MKISRIFLYIVLVFLIRLSFLYVHLIITHCKVCFECQEFIEDNSYEYLFDLEMYGKFKHLQLILTSS